MGCAPRAESTYFVRGSFNLSHEGLPHAIPAFGLFMFAMTGVAAAGLAIIQRGAGGPSDAGIGRRDDEAPGIHRGRENGMMLEGLLLAIGWVHGGGSLLLSIRRR